MTASAQRTAPPASYAQPQADAVRRGPVPARPGEDAGGRPTGAVAWMLFGLAGSVLLTLAGSRLGGGSVTWWFHPALGSDAGAERVFFYIGVGLLIGAWIGLGRLAREPTLRPRDVSLIVAVWSLPVALGAPLFSRDIYSYLAQGTIAHLGMSPYHVAPAVLARYGHGHVLHAVDPFWRHNTAPYGPLFLGVISLIVSVTGAHLVAGALLIRAFDLIGLMLLAVCVPRLARSLGGDPTRAVWLGVASPLVLLALVAPAHNDLLMAGALAAGVTLAVERRPLLAVAVCALAATVKLPAIVAVAFIALVWARQTQRRSIRLARLLEGAGAAALALAIVTVATGFGTGWVSGGLFSTPARVHLAITPATDFSWTIAKVAHSLGASLDFHSVNSVLRLIVFALSAGAVLLLALRSRRATLVPYLGLALVALAIGGPALWPWYLSWGVVLLAAWEPAQRSWLLIGALLVGAVLVKPGGILALPVESSPVVACLWIALAFGVVYRWRRRKLVAPGTPDDGIGTATSFAVER
jgi:alpha-1,6-mannosyltransferase